jgi:hypothetical protein
LSNNSRIGTTSDRESAQGAGSETDRLTVQDRKTAEIITKDIIFMTVYGLRIAFRNLRYCQDETGTVSLLHCVLFKIQPRYRVYPTYKEACTVSVNGLNAV